jgi:hypothetical protein
MMFADLAKLAADENTPVEQLEELARDNYELAIIMAKNPNANLEFLLKLGDNRPGLKKYVAQNPKMTVELLDRYAEEAISQLIGCDKTPEGIAKNPKTPAFILEKLAAYLKLIKINPPFFVQETIDCKESLAITIASNLNTPVYILENLVLNTNLSRYLSYAVAKNPNTPLTLLEKLAEEAEDYFFEVLLENQSFPPIERLKAIAEESRAKMLSEASNPLTEPERLSKLASTWHRPTRERVTGNPNTPIDVLLKLAPEFPQQFFSNPALPLMLLENPTLPKQIQKYGLFNILREDDIPKSFLLGAASHSDDEILLVVAQHRNTPLMALDLISKRSVKVACAVVRHRKTTPAMLSKLSKDKRLEVRQAVAANRNTPKEILERLFEDKSLPILSALARNPNTPVDILKRLGRYSACKKILLANPSTPLEMRKRL